MTTWEVLTRGTWLSLLLAASVAVAEPEGAEEAAAAAPDSAAAVEAEAEAVQWSPPKGKKVEGEVSGFWDPGIYRVKDVLTVPAGDSLYIAAGCSLYFDGPVDRSKLHINVLGYLEVGGTDSLPVYMASALPPGDPNRIWGGIMYVGNRAEGRVEHTVFKQAEIGVQVRMGVLADAGSIGGSTEEESYSDEAASDTPAPDSEDQVPEYILNRPTGPVTVRNCVIDSASFNGIVLVGVDSTVVIEDNRIENCTSGISIETGANPVIRRNLILNNVSTGIICSNNSSPYITQTTITGSQTAGIICSNRSAPVITESVIAKCGIGVSVTDSNPEIYNCTIAKNDFSGVIAMGQASPAIATSNLRDNGLSGIDNRGNGEITADRIWWGYIVTEDDPAPVIDAAVRRQQGETVEEGVNGSIVASNPLGGPSIDAPGTPLEAVSLTLSGHSDMSDPFGVGATVTNGDTIFIRMVAADESPHLEDQATIIISTSSGDPEGTQRVLNESEPNSGTYEGFVIASLQPGNPNIVLEVGNGDIIRVETGTTPPLSAQAMFVSKPPIISRLRVNGQVRGVRLIDTSPEFTWTFVDPEGDPQSATQIEMFDDPAFSGEPVWKHEETGRLVSYTYDGPPLVRGTTYYLRVRANDSYNWGRWRETNFHMNVPPPTPTLAYPADNTIISEGTAKPVLAVNNVVDQDGDPVSYIFEGYYAEDFENARLKVRGGSEPVEEDTVSGRTTWKNIPALLQNTRVWWRAQATDGLSTSDWSEARSLLLDTEDDPVIPFNMLEPLPDSTVYTIHPRLEWDYSYDPDPDQDITFVLKIGRDSSFTRGLRERVIMPTPEAIQYYQVPPEDSLLDNEYYWWTVRADQDGKPAVYANDDDPHRQRAWRFRVDTGNDPPQWRPVPAITMTEDTPYTIRVERYISDADNQISDIVVTARATPHILTEVRPGKEVVLTPEANWFGGPETIRLEAMDPLKSIGVGELRVTVVGVNDAPVVADIPAQTVNEDTDLRLNLAPYVNDIDNRPDDLRWTASYDQNKLSVSIERGTATIRGTADFTGENVPIRFTATDPGGLSGSATALVTVTPQNDAPRVEQIPLTVFNEDQAATISLDRHVNDPDNPTSSLTWSAVPDEPLSVEIDPASHVARISAPENFSGVTRRVVFKVKDPSGLENQIVAQVEVKPVNDPPVLASIPDQEYREDGTFTLDLNQLVTDPDNSSREMRWQARGTPNVQATVDPNSRRVTFTSPTNWSGGPETVRLTVTDPGGLSANGSVRVTVIAVPEPPEFTQIPQVTFDEDGSSAVRLDDYLSDPDHPNSRLTVAVSSPANVRAQLNTSMRTVSLSAPANWNGGPETVTVTATDPDGESSTTTFSVRVTPVNDPPMLSQISPTSFNEDASTTVTLTDFVKDPDNAPREMSWTFAGNTNVRASQTGGVATFSATPNWNGTETVTVTATDPGGLQSSTRVQVTVRPVNDPPTISAIPAVEFREDGSTSLNLGDYVSDLDNSPGQLTWRAAGGTNVNVVITGSRASFSATDNWHGAERITFTVRDPDGLEASGATQVTVTPVNDPPTVTAVPAQRFNEDESATVDLSPYGSDIDGDALRWTASSPNANVRTNVAGSTLTLNAAPNWNGGPVSVALTAADPQGASANTSVSVTVTPVNDPPALAAIPAVEFDEDGSTRLSLNDYISDPDDSPAQLSWTASGGTNVQVSVASGTATFRAAQNWHGAERITFTVRDVGGLQASGGVQVTVKPVNDPPQVSAIPPQTFNEDASTTVNLGPYGSDLDGDALTWSATSPNQNLSASVSGATLTLSGARDWNGGPVSVTVSAADRGGLSASTTVSVSVTSVNDPPSLSSIPAVRFDEDGTTGIDLNALVDDPDNTDAQLTWRTSGGSNVIVSTSGSRATFRANANWNGVERITFTVSDPGGLEASGVTQVTVVPVNDAPQVSAIPAQTFVEDGSATVNLGTYGSDPDGDALTWSASSPNPSLRASVSGATLTLSGASNWNGGPVSVAVSASDPGGLSANTTVSVQVTPVNDPPSLSSIPAVRFDEDGTTGIDLNALVDDPDNTDAQLTWRVSGGSNVVVSTTGGRATFRATPNWNGSERISFTVSDPGGLEASGTAQVTVNPVNDAPQVTAIPAQSFVEDGSATVDLSAYGSDPDGDALTWSTSSPNPSLRASVSGATLTLSAERNWNGGPVRVAVSASDPGGLSANTAVSVQVTPVNDPPSLSSIPAVRFDEDGTSSLDLNALVDDPDNTDAQLTWRASGATNVSVTISGGQATFRAPANWNGSERVTFTVSDPGGLEASGAAQVTVVAVNDAPQVNAIPAQSFDEDGSTTVNLATYGSDPDGDALTWSASSPNPSLRATVSGATLTLSAERDWNGGPISVAVSASDPGRLTANTTVSIRVNAVNDAPSLSTLPPVTFEEDGSGRLALNDHVSDPDDQPGTLSWTASGNTNIRVNISGGVATFSAPANWNGSERITITVRDGGGLTASQAVQVTVSAVNDPPSMGGASAVRFDEDASTSVDLGRLATDPDGDRLAFSATSGNPNVRASVSGTSLSLSAAPNWNGGPVNVTVTASDPAGAAATATIPVTVNSVNDEPSMSALPAVSFDEDGSATLGLGDYITDVDDTPAQMSWSASGARNVSVSFSGATATLSASANWNGSERVTITARDRAGATVSQPVQVTVAPVNDEPVVNVSGVTMDDNTTKNIDLSRYVSDADGDRLTWTYERQTGSLGVELRGSTLVVNAPRGASGTSVMILTVSDGSSAPKNVRLPVTVQ